MIGPVVLEYLQLFGYVLGVLAGVSVAWLVAQQWWRVILRNDEYRIAWNRRVRRNELAGEAGRLFMLAEQLDRSGFPDKSGVLRDHALRLSSQLYAETKRAREAKEI